MVKRWDAGDAGYSSTPWDVDQTNKLDYLEHGNFATNQNANAIRLARCILPVRCGCAAADRQCDSGVL